MVEIANQHGDAHSDSASSLNFLFQLSLTTSAKSGPHHKTEVLTLRPRFVIVNRLDQTVHYRQMGTMADSTLRSEHKTNFHWPDANAPFELCFRLLERDDGAHADVTHTDTMAGDGKMQHDLSRDRTVAYHWSGGCDIAMLGESHLRLRPIHQHGTALIMRIEVKNHEESLHVVLHSQTTRTPPYRIVNRSSSQVVVSQELSSEDGVQSSKQSSCDQIAPNASMPYAWDNPLLSHLLAIQVAGVAGAGGKMVVSLDAIGKTWSLSLLATDMVLPRNLVATVKADGPTKILTITDDVMISLLQDVHAASPGTMTHFDLAAAQLSNPDDGTRTVGRAAARAFGNISLSVSLDRVSITLVDKHPQELLSATFNSVSLVYMRGVDGKKNPNEFLDQGRFRSLDISVRTFQLDNMLVRTPYPVAVYSSRAMKEKELFFELSVLEDLNDTVTNVPILKKVQAGMQDLELNMEGRLVLQVYMYHVAMMESLRGLRGHGLHQHAASADEQLFAPSTARRIYFEFFSLPAVNLNFSFARRDLGEEEVSTALEVAQAISWLAASVDNAPLNLKTLELQHAFLETSTLLVVMREHYQKECLRQLYRIVGSVEVLGNPVGLFRNLGTGFRAFGSGVSGLRHGDQQSFKDGTKTLVRHGTHGLSNTISKVSSSVSRGVASVALDADFLRLRDEQKDNKERPEDFKVGFRQGTSHLANCFSSGFSGALTKPAQGYSTGGFKGLAQGMAYGVAGLICKPTSGLLDLIANTTEGIRNQTCPNGKRQIARYREPRVMSESRLLSPLHSSPPPYLELFQRLATYASSLPQALGGDLSHDRYYGHYVLAEAILIFTDKHCVLSSGGRSASRRTLLPPVVDDHAPHTHTHTYAHTLATPDQHTHTSDRDREGETYRHTYTSVPTAEDVRAQNFQPSCVDGGGASGNDTMERRGDGSIHGVEGQEGSQKGDRDSFKGDRDSFPLLLPLHRPESDDDERAKRGGGLNGHLTHDCIKASGLLWHVPWADVGGIKGQAGHGGVEGQFDGTRNGRDHSIVIQADPSVCATWDTLLLPDCGEEVGCIIHALHQAWSHGTQSNDVPADDEAELVA